MHHKLANPGSNVVIPEEYRGALEAESMNTETKSGHIEARLTEYDGRVVLLLNKSDLLKYGIKLLLFRSLFGMWEILRN